MTRWQWLFILLLITVILASAFACGGSGGGSVARLGGADDDNAAPTDDDNDASNGDDDNDDDNDNDDTVDSGFAFIPHGTFTMGSPPDEPGRYNDETQHQVTLTHDFEMSIYDTTQEQFATVMGWNPSYFTNCGDNCPVETVSWYDAAAYATELSVDNGHAVCYLFSDVTCADSTNVGADYMECMSTARGGIESATVTLNDVDALYECDGYRLPTESEWEYAARAGTTTAFYDGAITVSGDVCFPLDPNLDKIGWYCGNDNTSTKAVGGKRPNAWGLYDMSGNVFEWVWDWYGEYPSAATDPEGPATGLDRLFRGGSWFGVAPVCRSALREAFQPYNRIDYLGFRLARTLPEAAASGQWPVGSR
jgi:formylglycine-generating enzyme required for sulfatase activity